MTILCIETSTSVCSAAICKDGVPAEQCICCEGSNHARLLPRYIQHLLQYAAQHQLTIDAVALSEGPGSYTGLRIGTSTAKGLCYGLNVPLIPVPTLEILRLAAKEAIVSNQWPMTNACLIPMIDARRMEVYTAIFDCDKQKEERSKLNEARAVVVENEESLIKGQMDKVQSTKETAYYYFGDGAAKCQAVFSQPNWHYIPDIVPEARFLATYIETTAEPSIAKATDIAYYEPFYLKEFVAAQSHVKGLV